MLMPRDPIRPCSAGSASRHAQDADCEALPARPDRAHIAGLRGRLYGLACVIRAHLEREEWILVPLLDEG